MDSALCLPNISIDDYADGNRTSHSFSVSCQQSQSQVHGSSVQSIDQEFAQGCDFLDVISAISHVYSSGQYTPMLDLNDVRWEEVAGGRDFLVSRSALRLRKTSVLHQKENTTIHTKLIVKIVSGFSTRDAMRPVDMDLFVRELTVLHHLRGHENIVQLRGVGWAYDCLNDADLTPCPKPALLVEEAAGTLEWLLSYASDLPFLTEMKICKDVATGLLALHSCGLLHGDIKPANVLVFPEVMFEEGAEVFHFKCKISDFSLARVVGTHRYLFDWGTPPYMAPESNCFVPAHDLLSTDVWSLGVLFARVTQRTLNLKLAVERGTLGDIILRDVKESIRSSTWDSPASDVRWAIFEHTIQPQPKDRRLDRVVLQLETFFKSKAPLWDDTNRAYLTTLDSNITREIPKAFNPPMKTDVMVSYENFKYTSGQVHDAIVLSLQATASNSNDPRHAQAMFELAVFTLSDYAGPIDSSEKGLAWLRQSAALGDIRAQGMFHRIQKLFAPSTETSSETLTWLENAASLGHTIAIYDLKALDPVRAQRSQKTLAAQFCRRHMPMLDHTSSFDDTVSQNPETRPSSDSVHARIASGCIDGLENVFSELSLEINAKDAAGNTPLIMASRFLDCRVVLELLDLGADPVATNNVGENFMHFAGCFAFLELHAIISKIPVQHHQRLFLQDARGIKLDRSLDLFPRPPGTPLERAIAMNNPEAVSVLLHKTKDFLLANGQVMRRSLLLSLRLHLVEIQNLIIQHSQCEVIRDSNLPPFHETSWEYKGQKRNFLDAVLVGGVSGFGLGADVPLKWWRLCQLGNRHSSAMYQSINFVLSLIHENAVKERLIDAAFPLILHEKFSDSLRPLLDWKARVTDGNEGRIRSLFPLAWGRIEPPLSPIEEVYRMVIQGSFFLVPFLGSFSHYLGRETSETSYIARGYYRFQPPLAKVFKHLFAVNNKIGETRQLASAACWQAMQSESCDGTLERPSEIVNYVDQIFYNQEKGTLLHQAILSGDRATFLLLVHTFGANPALPAPGRYVGSIGVQQLNIYALVAHAAHCDLWFARQLRRMAIHFDIPLNFTPWSQNFYLPPLFHALRRRRWPYAQWLMHHGASLEQQTQPGWNVLSMCMTSQDLHRELLEFLFSHSGRGCGSAYLPAPMRQGDGFEVFQLIYESRKQRNGRPEFIDLYRSEKEAQHIYEDYDDYSDCDDDFDDQEPEAEARNPAADNPAAENDGEEGQLAKTQRRIRAALAAAWTTLPPHIQKRRDARTTRKRVSHYLLDTGVQDTTKQTRLPRVGQCWRYLLDVFPEVANSPTRKAYFRFSVPTLALRPSSRLLPTLRWLSMAIPYPWKPASILEQSLSMGIHSQSLYSLTFSHFRERANLRPATDPFPVQTWFDLLFGSPLDKVSLNTWQFCALRRDYGYWISIRDRAFYFALLIIIVLLCGVAFICKAREFSYTLMVVQEHVVLWIMISAFGIGISIIIFGMILYSAFKLLATRWGNDPHKSKGDDDKISFLAVPLMAAWGIGLFFSWVSVSWRRSE